MKTKSNKFLQILGCIVMLAIGAYLMTDISTFIDMRNGNLEEYHQALSMNNDDDVTEGYYQIEINAVFACFATEGQGQKISDWYYAAWLDDDSVVILTTDNKKTAAELDRICDETWAYLYSEQDSFTSEPITLNVRASAYYPDSDLAIMYKQTLENIGITDENFKIRYASISTSTADDHISNVIVGAVVLLIGIICSIVLLRKIVIERRKKLWGLDTSMAPNAYLQQVMTPQVTKSEAKKRITNPIIKNNYKSIQRKIVFCILCTIICIAIPIGMLLYNHHYSDAHSGSVKRYDMLNLNAETTAQSNDAAELVITEVPFLIYSYNDNNYYVIENERSFIAIMDNAQYHEAEASVKKTGSYKLIGYLEIPSTDIKEQFIDYFTSTQGSSISLADYESTYGKFMLHVQDDYNGSGFPIATIKTWAITLGIMALFFLYFAFDLAIKAGIFLKRLSYLSDPAYTEMEKELATTEVHKYPQNLYLTENYLVLLHSFSAFKNSSDRNSDSLFINFRDISWMYPSNIEQYGKIVNSGATVYNKTFGPISVLSLPANEQNMLMLQEIFTIISQKNPNVLFGYNEDNQQKMGA